MKLSAQFDQTDVSDVLLDRVALYKKEQNARFYRM